MTWVRRMLKREKICRCSASIEVRIPAYVMAILVEQQTIRLRAPVALSRCSSSRVPIEGYVFLL
jgi:hypothetical protein